MNDQLDRLKQAQKARREMLAQFRANQVKELKLPSGTVVFVRDVTMTDLMFSGKLPDALIDLLSEASASGKDEVDIKQIARNGQEFKILMDALVRASVVEPPIADIGDDDHLGIDEITGDDKMAIFNWSNREAEKLKPFREGESEPLEVVQHGDGVQLQTEPTVFSGNGSGGVAIG